MGDITLPAAFDLEACKNVWALLGGRRTCQYELVVVVVVVVVAVMPSSALGMVGAGGRKEVNDECTPYNTWFIYS